VKVGVDGRSLATAGAGRGVAHYTSALLGALARVHPEDEWHVVLVGDRGADPPLPPNLHLHRVRRPPRLVHAAGALGGRPRLDRFAPVGLDVFWAPAPAPLAISKGLPLVLTLHDLSWEERPGDFTRYERAWHAIARPERLAREATRVITVSRATREAAVPRWALDPARVIAVPSGVAQLPVPDAKTVVRAREDAGLPERYLLFVGALEPRKAPDVLARAYAQAKELGLDAALAFVGDGRLSRSLAGPGIHLLGAVDDHTRDALCAGALALVLPSWLEGFGLPPLEALALGTPSVLSDLPVYAETIGDGALRFPPGDEDALAGALHAVAADPALRAGLLERGRSASAELTWERAAHQTREVLAEAAGSA
jgi:glycosyltransferase involved in cell wall biosynthesis